MDTSAQLANRFREVVLNGKWIANTNYKELLNDTTYVEASQQIGSLNTIAALTFHVNYYLGGVLQVLEGGKLEIHDKYSFNFPPIESKEAWLALKESLFTNAENFATAIEKLPAEKLEKPFVNLKYGNYRRNIEGMIEHCYYHLGQISLLKKLIAES